jgi:hypothetical protein
MGAACCRLIGFGRRSLPDPIMYLLLGYLVPKIERTVKLPIERRLRLWSAASDCEAQGFFKDFVM